MRKSISIVAIVLAASVAHAADPITVSIPPTLKAITTGKPPPSHESPPLLVKVKLVPQLIKTYAEGTGALVKGMFTRKFGGFNRALVTANKLSDERLQKMPADVSAELAGVLLKGKLFSTAATKQAANKQFLRVLTSRGRDAGHVQGTLTRLGIFDPEDAAKKLQPEAAAEFRALMTEIAPQPGDWGSFRGFVENATGALAREGSNVELLVNGSTYFPALKKAMEGAKKFLMVQKFAIHSDPVGEAVMGDVADAAKRGVRTHVMFDPVGSVQSERKVFAAPLAAGTQVVANEPKLPLGGNMDHRKIVAADLPAEEGGGLVAFNGGMNVGTEYESVWHDIQSMLTGPIAADFAKISLAKLKESGAKVSRGLKRAIKKASEESLSTPAGDMIAYAVNHTGLSDQNEKAVYLQATKLAQKRIWLENPYMTDDDMVKELIAAAKRGVDVRIIMPARNDEKLLAWAERARFNALLDAGVKVFQFVGDDLNNPQMAHGKVGLFDDELATIGSSNLDQRSLKNNDEANVWVQSKKLNQELATRVFEADFPRSKQILKYKPTELDKIEDTVLRKESTEL